MVLRRKLAECARIAENADARFAIDRCNLCCNAAPGHTLRRFRRSGLGWPVPSEMTDTELEVRLYGVPGVKPGRRKLPEPDWAVVAREFKRKHVTLEVLWQEYYAANPDGYRYSRWCDLFLRWEGRLPLVMRQSHADGDKLFVAPQAQLKLLVESLNRWGSCWR